MSALWQGLAGRDAVPASLTFTGSGNLSSAFCVSPLAAAATGVAGVAAAEFISARAGVMPDVQVDRRLASHWFRSSVEPIDWSLPELWDSVAGVYACADGWIRLHTNAPHHRVAALTVLGLADTSTLPVARQQVAAAIHAWHKSELEQAIVKQGGCAAAMLSAQQWQEHPQGQAVAAEPLIDFGPNRPASIRYRREEFSLARPLTGIRVLDLTRVLAGPVATRLLAGLGAEVLRLDPPDWNEPAVLPDVTVGKRCARVDLKSRAGRAVFEALLADADVLVHGYRSDALDRLGLGSDYRQRVVPGLVDVCLNAYGWSGPWRERRGFDSLVQMSSGIAHAGMLGFNKQAPFPLPVQALDHATGNLMAAAVLRGLTEQVLTGCVRTARLSLARTAVLLSDGPAGDHSDTLARVTAADQEAKLEHTSWGALKRTRFPLQLAGVDISWAQPAGELGSSEPHWLSSVPR